MIDARWLDRAEYPFRSRYFETGEGRMHYVDEGEGEAVVLVHGTPTWSFLYRHLIRGLSERGHRVIAPDHLGFGLSEKPEGAFYRPRDHARRLSALIAHLGLRDLTLVVHDFGGPIGLSHAIEHPGEVRRLVLFNTWMWSLRGQAPAEKASRFMGGPVGRFLYRRLNFSPRVLLPAVMGEAKLGKEAHRHYLRAFPGARDRQAPWVLARELIGSSDWYGGLWDRRERIRDLPALLLWGMKDPTFSPADLERWTGLFTHAEVARFPGAGHLVQEEEGAALVPRVASFLESASAV